MPLQTPLTGTPAAAAPKRCLPAWPTGTATGIWPARQGLHPPASKRGGNTGCVSRQEQCRGPTRFGGQLQPTAGGEIGRHAFAQHGGKAAAAQALFHGPEHLRRASRFNQDHVFGFEAEASKPRPIRQAGLLPVAVAPAPQHHSSRLLSAQALQQGSGKAEGGAITVAAHDFMQAATTQAAPGQRFIDRGIAEADHGISRFSAMIQSAEPLAQIG
jgi:hypothetical protein